MEKLDTMDKVDAYIKRKAELAEIEKVEREKAVQKLGGIFPHVSFSHTNNLGEATSFHLSLDSNEKWFNGIFHNSNYVIFIIHADENKLTLIGSGLKMPDFRKCKIKSFDHALEKVAEYGLKAVEALKK
jgi:hypothetical protein